MFIKKSIERLILNGDLPQGYELTTKDVGRRFNKEFGRVKKKHVGLRVRVTATGGIDIDQGT